MNVYIRISKHLGHEGYASVPDKERTIELCLRARAGEESAFAELFRIVRFADPLDEEEIQRLNKIYKCWSEMSIHFRQQVLDAQHTY